MGTGLQKDQTMFRSLKHSAPAHFHPPGGEEDLELKLMTDHAHVMQPPFLKEWHLESFRSGEHK